MIVLLLNPQEIEDLMPVSRCIELMEGALRNLSEGRVVLPLRQVLIKPDKTGALGSMPVIDDAAGAMAVKVISVFQGNAAKGLESHQGVVILFDGTDGRVLAILDAGAITAIRTAAASGLATRLLARRDAGDLAILGSGVQARTHLAAMMAARKIRRVRIWSPNQDHARAFAERESERHKHSIEVATSAKEAVAGADLICTVTASRTPVLEGEWIGPGTHINAVGSSLPTTRELDSKAVAGARLFADRAESVLHESGDFLMPLREGLFGESHLLGELGDLILKSIQGRIDKSDITLFKSLGIAVEDLASANFLYQQAKEKNAGIWIDPGKHEV
jgi:ornithine cyclodeaminase/alanine dehydrogenase-like protein (mu-crystallin family)